MGREETPLFLASKEGSYDCVELLLSHFANRELTDYMDRLPRDIAAAKMHRDIVDLLERSTNHMGTSHYEQTFAMNQYQKKITTKKRPRVSAPMGGANGGGGSRAGGAQNASKRSAKRSATNAFAKSSQNLTTLPGGFGSTTLSPPQDHHYMQHHPHLGHFHTLGHSSMNHRAISMAAGLNPGAYGSAPTTPARGQFYQGDLHNQSMPHGGYAYGVQHHVYEQYMRSPIAHAAPHVVQHHRFSMTNNYPFAFGDSLYARRDVYEQPSTGAQPATQPTGQSGGTPRSGETSNDNPYLTLTPESNHDEQSSDQWKQSPASNEINTTFSPGLNNPNQNSPNSVNCTMFTDNNMPQPRFSEMANTATTTF